MNSSPIAQEEGFESQSGSPSNAAVLDPDVEIVALPPAKYGRCEKCETAFRSDMVSVCGRCGWYPSLQQFVDVDQDWDFLQVEDEAQAAAPQQSHLEVWLALVPNWGWILMATLAAVVVESVVVRLVTPAGSSLRTTWSLAQLVIGLTAFVGCHVFNFLTAAADDSDFGALDLVLRPFKLWLWALRRMPARQWVTDTAAAGLMAALMSVVVIGGLPYERLWDWGLKAPKKQNLMGAVMSQVQKVQGGEGADNIEDAVSDFAGQQNLDAAGAGNGAPTPPPKPREETDCVILGYRLDAQKRLTSLVLGTALGKQLVYAGTVTPKLPAEDEATLVEALSLEISDRPYLDIPTTATWVKPQITCRVSYEKQRENGSLADLRLEELSGHLNLE